MDSLIKVELPSSDYIRSLEDGLFDRSSPDHKRLIVDELKTVHENLRASGLSGHLRLIGSIQRIQERLEGWELGELSEETVLRLVEFIPLTDEIFSEIIETDKFGKKLINAAANNIFVQGLLIHDEDSNTLTSMLGDERTNEAVEIILNGLLNHTPNKVVDAYTIITTLSEACEQGVEPIIAWGKRNESKLTSDIWATFLHGEMYFNEGQSIWEAGIKNFGKLIMEKAFSHASAEQLMYREKNLELTLNSADVKKFDESIGVLCKEDILSYILISSTTDITIESAVDENRGNMCSSMLSIKATDRDAESFYRYFLYVLPFATAKSSEAQELVEWAARLHKCPDSSIDQLLDSVFDIAIKSDFLSLRFVSNLARKNRRREFIASKVDLITARLRNELCSADQKTFVAICKMTHVIESVGTKKFSKYVERELNSRKPTERSSLLNKIPMSLILESPLLKRQRLDLDMGN